MIDIDLLLALGGTYKKVSQGEIIFLEGGRCNFYHQLVSGRVKWININNDGKEYLQSVIEPGESFGELPLFDGEPYAATAIADEDSILIRLHQSTFHQLIEEHPEIHMAFSKLLAQRLRFKFFLLRELLYSQPEERISSLINYLKDTKHNICQCCGKVKLTRQQIANMTCLRVETVIRTMRHMHDKGEIVIKKGKVYCGVTPVISAHCPN
ncbi:MAG: transcriptional regulator, Crp/Fnr family [Flavipsychrobacter sp.]|jgi:CRP-like cAMP-binding protein|nr:transcriptional regulator, Crp/Fnr family [Flavipsychrobacter sp.]